MKPQKLFALLLGAAISVSVFSFTACSPDPPQPENPDSGNVVPEQPEDNNTYSVKLEKQCYLIAGDEEAGSYPLSPVVRVNKTVAEGAVCSYSVSDPSVAEVSESGVVSARSYGAATVTATYTAESGKTASADVKVMVFEDAAAQEINSFDEKFVNLYGRIDVPEDGVDLDNVGAGIEIAFYGDTLKAKLEVDPPKNGMDLYGRVFVDGVMLDKFEPFRSGDEVTLAENLGMGAHTLAVHKSSEIDEGRLTVKEFYADRFLRIPEKSDLKMEFIGDSITCGYGNLIHGSAGVTRNSDNSDGCLSYAFLTGKELGADFSMVSYSGICVKADRWGAHLNMAQLHTYTSLQTKKPYSYDPEMNVVVLNLGTNDASYIQDVDVSYKNQFSADYKEFLTHLRDVYPRAYIVCCYGMMGLNDFVNDGIEKAIEDMNDTKISYKTFSKNDAGVNSHPYRAAHETYAKQLSAYIRGLLAN